MPTPHHGTPEELQELRSRIEALELRQRIHSAILSAAEQAELGVVTRAEFEAAIASAASDARQAATDELRARVEALHSYKVGKAEPIDDWGLGHTLANAAPTSLDRPGGLVEPFVVRHYSSDTRPCIKGNGFDGLEIGEDRQEAEEFVQWVNARMTANPQSAPATELENHQ